MRFSTSLVLAAAMRTAVGSTSTNVKNVIVLMMENRSFDHMLGHLAKTNPEIDGLTGAQGNPTDPLNASSPIMPVNYDAIDGGPDDPCHSFDCITQQVFGFDKEMNDTTSPVMMDGFVANAEALKANVPFVMSAFESTNLPVLSTLATEFAVFDHWHCACPCPTNPNREFLMSGTSNGKVDNNFPDGGFPQQTHFKFLEARGISWKIYYNDDPWMAPTFADLRTNESLALIQEMPAFFTDLEEGTLPQYSLIQPRMAASATGPSNWQHPDGSVEQGEVLMAQIYDALRSSQYWEDTLLIITYDEHGGFFDHQPTPATGVPAPDDVPGENGFDYSRLGVRIPTVMVSPWIAKGTVVHEPSGARAPTPTSQYDATSIISSANKIFGISENMTRRDAWAGTFHDIVSTTSNGGLPRSDCPLKMPAVRQLTERELATEQNRLLNDHHLDSINLLCGLDAGHSHAACAKFASTPARTEEQASVVAQLQARAGLRVATDASVWDMASTYEHLFPPVARLLRQKDFEAISKSLYSLYKQQVIV